MSITNIIYADNILGNNFNNGIVRHKDTPIYVNKYVINISGRERYQEGGLLYWKFLNPPPLNKTMNDMFQGIFRHEDICCILNLDSLVQRTDKEMISLYNKMVYIYDSFQQYDGEMINVNNKNINAYYQLYWRLSQAKLCANLHPYGVSSILCDSTGRLAKPIVETNSAYILIRGRVRDDRNAFSTNDTLRLPSSKILPSSKEIPKFDTKSIIGTLYAVLITQHKPSTSKKPYLIFDIKFIATKNISVAKYCSKRSLPFIQLGTFECLELADNNEDIYSHTPTNHSEEYTYFPNFVFNSEDKWNLPSTIIPYNAEIHENLKLLVDSENIDELFFNGNVFFGDDRYLPITYITKKSDEDLEEELSKIDEIDNNKRKVPIFSLPMYPNFTDLSSSFGKKSKKE